MKFTGQNNTITTFSKLFIIPFLAFILSVSSAEAYDLLGVEQYTSEGYSYESEMSNYEENDDEFGLNNGNEDFYNRNQEESRGDDDDDDDGDNEGSHRSGQDCKRCHRFSIAGTVYSNLAGASTVSGATIQVNTNRGTISMVSDRLGNFYSNSSFSGSYSASIRHGSSPASMGIRPSTGGCNSGACHAPGGSAGGRIYVSGRGSASLSTPSNLNARVSGSALTLGWNSVSGATGYSLYYGFTSGNYIGPFPLGNVTSVTFSDIPEGVYYAAVSSSNGAAESFKSNEVTITVGNGTSPTSPVSAPTGFAVSVSGSSITLTWNAVTNATDYKLYYGLSLGSYINSISLGNVTSISFSGAPDGTYYAALTASNSSGESSKSIDIEIRIATTTTPTPTPAPATTYTSDVKIIMSSKCTVCHKSGGIRSQTPLTTYSEVKARGSALLSKPGSGTMASVTLSSSEKATISDWISGGYLE